MKRVRCAIYTRKSSEEGLDQTFNSLDAQREACAAYILSQASEGWAEVPETYDDGGLSGGTLERPALQRLLADVAAKRIDIIVVYKVDRLTRSLLDFAKLVEAFDKAETSFVSVTQSFNTTTSMGRLTLNMLLSFAQFEREVTAERIRDKIAASKAKGMWMGGIPPLGYKPNGRTLAIVEEHAAITRHIFSRYAALGNVRLLESELVRDRIVAPARVTATGKQIGARPFSRGQLYLMLKCVTFTGKVGHRGKVYEGQHPAIIDEDVFAHAQALLADNTLGTRSKSRAAHPSPLAGKIFDGTGRPLVSTHTSKGASRYRYYVSHDLHHTAAATGLRIPAREIEKIVAERVRAMFADPLQVITTAWLDVAAHRHADLTGRCEAFAGRRSSSVFEHVAEVHVDDKQIAVHVATSTIADALATRLFPEAPAILVLTIDARLTRSGRVLRLVNDRHQVVERTNTALIKLLIQARRLWGALRQGDIDVTTLAAREGISPAYLTRVLRLAFLSPTLVEAILAGQQPAGMDVGALTLRGTVLPLWSQQGRAHCSGDVAA